MLPEVTAAVRPPRALSVPWELGFPLGKPDDKDGQRTVVRRLLALCTRGEVPFIEEL